MSLEGKTVEIRAFRGTRRASVYHEHRLPEGDFSRILDAAAAHDLPLLTSLARHGPHELNKAAARQLAEEATDVRISGELLDLDQDLTAIVEVARWCARAPDRSWMNVRARN
jgi:hypothetical protein